MEKIEEDMIGDYIFTLNAYNGLMFRQVKKVCGNAYVNYIKKNLSTFTKENYDNAILFLKYYTKSNRYLIIDLETTGFPRRSKGFPSYMEIDKYDTARIVQMSWLISDKQENIKDYIIKPDNFIIPDEVIAIHKISNEIANTQGILLEECIKDFVDDLKNIDTIIAHNIEFDINVLRSELCRYGYEDVIKEINKKKFLCTMRETVDQLKIPKKTGGYKFAKLSEMYEILHGEECVGMHNAKQDVYILNKCVNKLKEKKMLLL